MLRRAFNRVSAFQSTTFLIVVNFIFFPSAIMKGISLMNIMSSDNSTFSFCLLFDQVLPHSPILLFLFFYSFTVEGADVRAKDCVSFLISVTVMGKFSMCCNVPCAWSLLLMGIPPFFMRIFPFLRPVVLDLWSLVYFLQKCAWMWRHTSLR